MTEPAPVYVASSWRNERYPGVIARLRVAKIPHYDFREPRPGDRGFHWSDVWNEIKRAGDADWHTARGGAILRMLRHPIAANGFASDFDALQRAGAVILILPAGRSAHLELGYAVGAGKATAILMDNESEADLMWKMADMITTDIDKLIDWCQP